MNHLTYGLDASVVPEQRYTLALPIHTGVLTSYQNYERDVWDAEFDNHNSINEFTFSIFDGRDPVDSAILTATPMFLEIELED